VPTGGLARRATAIKSLLTREEGIPLIFDAGSSLMGEWVSLASQGRVIVEAMNQMGYDAMVIGRMDLLKGIGVAQARAKEAAFAVLSANLVSKRDEKPLFDPYAVIIKKGVRIGVIGLSDETALRMPGVAEEAKLLDPQETARRYVSELSGRVDVLIVLSRLGLEEDRALAYAVPGIHVIVGGKTRQLMNEPERMGNTIIVQQGYDGEWLGYLKVTFDAQGVPLSARAMPIPLTEDFPDDPRVAAIVERYKAQYPTPTPWPTPTPRH